MSHSLPKSLHRRLGLALALCTAFSAFPAKAQEKAAPPATSNNPNSSITLPVGGEWTRSYDAGLVSVHLVSRPFFSASPTGAPALEVGPVSLTFIRNKKGGALLVFGNTSLALPDSITLGDDGRSAQPLDLTLSYDQAGGNAKLLLGGNSFPLNVAGSSGSVGVVATAGDEQGWSLDTFDIKSSASSAIPIAESDTLAINLTGLVPRELNPTALAADRAKDLDDALALSRGNDLAGAEAALLRSNIWQKDAQGWTLESASRMIQLALVLRQQNDFKRAIAVAQRVLVILKDVQKPAFKGTAHDQSEAYAQAAFVHDEILHDSTAARADLVLALKADGQSVRARKAVERLDEVDAKITRLGAKR